jgi:hypothetical protein
VELDPGNWRLGGEEADEVEDQVLGTDVRCEAARDLDLDGLRHLDVEGHAEGPDAGHLGGADAEGEGVEGAVARGVGVGAHDDRAGPDVAVLGEDLVADAALVAADVVEAGDAVLRHELADLLLVARGLGGLGGHPMVEDDGDLREPDHRLEVRRGRPRGTG